MRQGSIRVIRGGTNIDARQEALCRDFAVVDGKIVDAALFTIQQTKRSNATVLAVTPGFVDIHTHYDAQRSGATPA